MVTVDDYRSSVAAALPHTFSGLALSQVGERVPGKVRDSFVSGDRRIIVTSDRLSAFDAVLTTIPFKGQLLNGMARFWFDATSDIAPNHLIDQPHPNVFVVKQVEIIPVEVVVRGYLAGSSWRNYRSGRPVSGIPLPPGMREFERFPEPLITPSTKAPSGVHDEPISAEELLRGGLVEKRVWEEVCERALGLFRRGSELSLEHGLILVDTKYEFGLTRSGEVLLADEIHTPDSSRYWIASTYAACFREGQAPEMLDKEFVRRWLIERGYMGNGPLPAIPDTFRIETALRYIEAFNRITGEAFKPLLGDQREAIEQAVGARPQ